MKKITVNTKKQYDIYIGENIVKNAFDLFEKDFEVACVITDDNVDRLYFGLVEKIIKDKNKKVIKYAFTPGDKSKSIETMAGILEFMAENKMDRGDIVIALGGGVCGDIAGLCASLYLRGVAFIQIPTTLLAQVDSSVGGKCAVNLNAGKNLCGAFYQPDMVVCDVSFLNTLSEDEFKNGMAEVIKYGALFDEELFKNCINPKSNLKAIIQRCIELKKEVVEEDEKDTGRRQLLNFGHTLGHAIEKYSDFKISHGKAVGIGMAVMQRACDKNGLSDCAKRLENMLMANGLDWNFEYDDRLIELILNDKKIKNKKINLVLLEDIGKGYLKCIDTKSIYDFIKAGF